MGGLRQLGREEPQKTGKQGVSVVCRLTNRQEHGDGKTDRQKARSNNQRIETDSQGEMHSRRQTGT